VHTFEGGGSLKYVKSMTEFTKSVETHTDTNTASYIYVNLHISWFLLTRLIVTVVTMTTIIVADLSVDVNTTP
jgi:hypothetical protein